MAAALRVAGGPEHNAPGALIANLDETTAFGIKVSAEHHPDAATSTEQMMKLLVFAQATVAAAVLLAQQPVSNVTRNPLAANPAAVTEGQPSLPCTNWVEVGDGPRSP